MTSPEGNTPLYEATPAELVHALLAGAALRGEINSNAFTAMQERVGIATQAFAEIMLQKGCPPTHAIEGNSDGETRFWVLRESTGKDSDKYGGGRLMNRHPLSRHSAFYAIVVDAQGQLTTAYKNGHGKYYEVLNDPDIRKIFNVDALTADPTLCSKVEEQILNDLASRTTESVSRLAISGR